MVFKRQLTPLKKGGQIDKHEGKGAVEQRLSAGEKQTLTKGKPLNRSMNNYAKATPFSAADDDPAPVFPTGV